MQTGNCLPEAGFWWRQTFCSEKWGFLWAFLREFLKLDPAQSLFSELALHNPLETAVRKE